MIILNESSLSGLVHTSVTNNWIVYRIEWAVVVKKATLNLSKPHDVDGLLKQKLYWKCTRLFLRRRLYCKW